MEKILYKLPALREINAAHIVSRLKRMGVSSKGLPQLLKSNRHSQASDTKEKIWSLSIPAYAPEQVKPGPCRVSRAYGMVKESAANTRNKPRYTFLNPASSEYHKQVRHIMDEQVWTVHYQESLESVLNLCLEKKLIAMPVLDHQAKVKGFFSLRAFFAGILCGLEEKEPGGFWQREIGDFLAESYFTVTPDTALNQAIQYMFDMRLKQLFVVEQARLVGVIHIESLIHSKVAV